MLGVVEEWFLELVMSEPILEWGWGGSDPHWHIWGCLFLHTIFEIGTNWTKSITFWFELFDSGVKQSIDWPIWTSISQIGQFMAGVRLRKSMEMIFGSRGYKKREGKDRAIRRREGGKIKSSYTFWQNWISNWIFLSSQDNLRHDLSNFLNSLFVLWFYLCRKDLQKNSGKNYQYWHLFYTAYYFQKDSDDDFVLLEDLEYCLVNLCCLSLIEFFMFEINSVFLFFVTNLWWSVFRTYFWRIEFFCIIWSYNLHKISLVFVFILPEETWWCHWIPKEVS